MTSVVEVERGEVAGGRAGNFPPACCSSEIDCDRQFLRSLISWNGVLMLKIYITVLVILQVSSKYVTSNWPIGLARDVANPGIAKYTCIEQSHLRVIRRTSLCALMHRPRLYECGMRIERYRFVTVSSLRMMNTFSPLAHHRRFYRSPFPDAKLPTYGLCEVDL